MTPTSVETQPPTLHVRRSLGDVVTPGTVQQDLFHDTPTCVCTSLLRSLVDWRCTVTRLTTWCHYKPQRTLITVESRSVVIRGFPD